MIMTQEEKAKRYDEAIERAKEWYSDVQIGIRFKDNLEKLFPELKGSKDERIREALIALLKFGLKNGSAIAHGFNETKEQALAWLEKQGEDKEINNFDVLPGLYKCVHRMFDGTPDGKLLFEIGNIYKCLSKHDRAEFEVSYGHSVYLEDPVVCKHFIPFENQGEQKPFDYENANIQQKGFASIEPKFKVGDWITNGEYTWKVISVDYLDYTLQNQWGECVEDTVDYVNKAFHLWTIQDAKDGDVIAFDNGTIVIFKDLYNSTSFHSYCYIECGIFDFNKNELPDWWEGEGFNPSTKEQSDILFQKMKEAGYVWDTDKKELRKEEIK